MSEASAALRPIVVTGATGNVGRPVVEALLARGAPVRAAVTSPARARPLLGDAIACVSFDFHRPETFPPLLEGARGLFLLRPPAISRVERTLNALVDAAKRAGVEQIVFLSVAGAERNPLIPHHAVEQHLRRQAPSWTILRPGFFAQNLGDAYRDDILRDDRLFVPAGDGRAAFVDVRDVGEVAALAFFDDAHRGQAFTLTGPSAFSFDEVAALLTEALGRPIRYARPGVLRYARHLRARGLPWAQIGVLTALHVGLRVGQAEAVDPTLARLLGRAPRSVRDYIADHQALWARSPEDARTSA